MRDRLGDHLERDHRIHAAWQYGSSLRSDYQPDVSDIDILLIVGDDTSLDDYTYLAALVRRHLPTAEVTVLRKAEATAAIHPGWSRHFFINVSRSGVLLCGPDLLAAAAALPLSLDEAYQRLVQLTQRARLVCINPSKSTEARFWLTKYQHWIPLCLMELLELAGAPEERLQNAHASFLQRFPTLRTDLTFPYPSLRPLTAFLEQLVRWIPPNARWFDGPTAVAACG